MVEMVLICSLFTYGYCATLWEGHILEKFGDWLEENLPEYIFKPMGGCVICASFWFSTAIYWIMWANDWKEWFLVALSSVGVNAIISNLINKIEDISKPPE